MLLIRTYRTSDHLVLNEIIDNAFGEGYHQSKNYTGDCVFTKVAEYDSKIVGCSIGRIIGGEGILDLIVVDSGFRNKGIGAGLFVARSEEFKEREVFNLKLYHWVKKISPYPKLAMNDGFVHVETIPDFWKEVSVKNSFHCAECGPPPCSCVCALYQKKSHPNF